MSNSNSILKRELIDLIHDDEFKITGWNISRLNINKNWFYKHMKILILEKKTISLLKMKEENYMIISKIYIVLRIQ